MQTEFLAFADDTTISLRINRYLSISLIQDGEQPGADHSQDFGDYSGGGHNPTTFYSPVSTMETF